MRLIKQLSFVLIALSLGACTKVMVYGKDRPVDPVVRHYAATPQDVYAAAKSVLTEMGYKIGFDSDKRYRLRTGWQPTTADSHYVELFGRKDYGTVGAYYRIHLYVEESDGASDVSIMSTPRSTVPNVKSSGRVEKKILDLIANQLRPDDIEITNVGLQEKRTP